MGVRMPCLEDPSSRSTSRVTFLSRALPVRSPTAQGPPWAPSPCRIKTRLLGLELKAPGDEAPKRQTV